MNIIEHRNQLNNYGVTLHSRIVGILVDRIESAIERGDIRSQFVDGQDKLSVYDFMRVILMVKSEREVWKRLCDNDSQTVTICDGLKFDRSNNRAGNAETPATGMAGLLYIAYQANSEFSHQLRSSSAAHFVADRKIPTIKVPQESDGFHTVASPNTVTIPDSVENFPRLAGLAQTEICRLADEYLRVRDVAAETMPTLIEILDALAIPGAVPAATNWFTARSWLAGNGYIFSQLKQRQFFQAIANTHRFLTATPPQKHNGINYYSNQHDILLKACAANVLKLGFKRTATFI